MTPGPGFYGSEGSGRVSNLSGSSFRSRTPQRQAADAWRAPPPGAYDVDAAAGVASVTAFKSKEERVPEPHRPTGAHLGPGTYTPAAGLEAAAQRQAVGGAEGAESFPFSSTSMRSSQSHGLP
eukprot:2545129-Prymnesium_polylepis.1